MRFIVPLGSWTYFLFNLHGRLSNKAHILDVEMVGFVSMEKFGSVSGRKSIPRKGTSLYLVIISNGLYKKLKRYVANMYIYYAIGSRLRQMFLVKLDIFYFLNHEKEAVTILTPTASK